MALGQRSFDDLGTPLHEVTFCVLDLETTGGSPVECAITEVGAVKLRGGECLGTFSTLVDPGQPIPPFITVLTGITESMVAPAPRIDEVLPAFLEFSAGTVLVGHNVRFDLAFLAAALQRTDRPRLEQRVVDTCALARRLLSDEVHDCRLGTLARQLRLSHRPSHRALADALATGDLLHALLERAGSLGVLGLDDLLDLPTVRGHPQLAKLRLTDGLPRAPGVYLFRDAGGRVLYVGKAANLRSRVRSYFSGDGRRKIGPLLREATAVDHVVTGGPLEAAVLEVRLIQRHLPRFNRQATNWHRYRYVELTLDERFPRLTVVRTPRPGRLSLGPFSGTAAARRVVDAIESAAPLRRCTGRVPRTLREAPCAPAQLGMTSCPCAGTIDEAGYAEIVALVVEGLRSDAGLLVAPLARRMHALAAVERYEEAAVARDRAVTLAASLRRQRRLDALRQAGRIAVEVAGQGGALIDGGRLVRSWPAGAEPTHPQPEDDVRGPAPTPVPADLVDEVTCVARWLDETPGVRVLWCAGELASPLLPVPPPPVPAMGRSARPGRTGTPR